jgi:hypothetical protein
MDGLDTLVLDRLFDPLARSLTPDAARVISTFRADAETEARIDELAQKCNEGRLSPEEQHEYRAFVEAIDIIAILQDKAREVLERVPQS